jgi:predicted nuclease of restriction endonuclease-like RecB superfamily
LVPGSRLAYSLHGDRVVPHFLEASDHPWLRALLEEYERFVGRPYRELVERLGEEPRSANPTGKRRLAIHVLERASSRRNESAAHARRVRAAVFEEAARSRAARDIVLASVAKELGMRPNEVEAALFADLPSERVVSLPDPPWSAGELALRANLALAQGLLFRATGVTIEVAGNARALVRYAKLRGLICTVAARSQTDDAVLELSGPFSLFRRTLLYGRVLGELIPLLVWCRRFRLQAECLLRERRVVLPLATGDPIFPAREPRCYDSKIEERFAREFSRATRDWDVVREPEPVKAGTVLLFPDFALQHRIQAERRWLLEIVGFWTPEYLARKLSLYRRAGLANLILCIDEDRRCTEDDLPPGASVFRFRRRVDVDAVLQWIERRPPPTRRVPETFQS